MLDWWGDIIHEYYASTESVGLTWVTPEQWRERPGTVGRPLVGVPHILAEDGRELAPGQDGAVWFSDGPTFEYHNDPGKTSAVTNERGWQTFGDIGHLDEDGFLYLTDRASYMIISGGVNVYPQEAEDALQSHPAVMDAAVFGIPDPDFGEAVHAVVQPLTMPADDSRRRCPRGPADRALPEHARGAQVPPLDRLQARAAANPDRQAAQAPAQGRVRIGGRACELASFAGGVASARPPGHRPREENAMQLGRRTLMLVASTDCPRVVRGICCSGARSVDTSPGRPDRARCEDDLRRSTPRGQGQRTGGA